MQNNVKATRMARGLQQNELAKLVGISRQTLSLIEKGQYNPSLKLCINIAHALGSDLNQLFWKELDQ
ncbi:helix-turn-helix transcriptional regulator (plasmid) [Nicoliella spurrieriana]|uniref:Helix-turn-helix transcriptional regulator n=1 Tax=Nicoliella spurrieriana TaxID=2925830 RepID=A0A976RQC4_9LACO|nr:helix-turn-helix transcriptional regulator [Nicoliella spurrieriana]UQS85939.1 helix-turn-helix transcriptional regulator [Nicoliella spurrieriana]